MKQALPVICGLLIAALALCISLWRRDVDALTEARAAVTASAATAETHQARTAACMAVVDGERAAVESCRREAGAATDDARRDEREACDRLVMAAEARGSLDVDATDLEAVARALRGRR